MKTLILILSITAIVFSGCINISTQDNIKTWDGEPSPILSIYEYSVISISKDTGDYWVTYNDNGEIKVAYVRPAHGERYKINDRVIISKDSKIIVEKHLRYTTYVLYYPIT